jgi:hypothetical protein
MDDAVDLMLGEDAVKHLGVVDVALIERHAIIDEVTVSAGEVVDDHCRKTLVGERAHNVRADVSGAPGDQPGHCFSPPVRSRGQPNGRSAC